MCAHRRTSPTHRRVSPGALLLRRWDYRTCTSAPTPDLVIAEYHVVEDANGIKLAAQLKSVRPELPVLLLSATEEPAGLEHVEAFVHKLEGPTVFLDKVQQLLKLRM